MTRASRLFGRWRNGPSLAESIIGAEHETYPSEADGERHPNVYFLLEPDHLNANPIDPEVTVVVTNNPREKEIWNASSAAEIVPYEEVPYRVMRDEDALEHADAMRAATHV